MATVTLKTKQYSSELVEVSTRFLLKFIKNCETAYENHPDVFDNDEKKTTRGMIMRGMDYAEKLALKSLPEKNEHTGAEGEPIVLTWEK